MTKFEIEAIIKHKFPLLSATELLILDEYCEAVFHRLKQVREAFTESHALKSWESYKAERLPVYNALSSNTLRNKK